MVLFNTEGLGRPGLQPYNLSDKIEEHVTIIAGESEGEEPWTCCLPLAYTKAVPFIAKAFSNELYEESQTRTLRLPEDSPASIKLLMTWIYLGLKPSTNDYQSMSTWAEFYVTCDRMQLPIAELCLKHIWNLVTVAIGENKSSPESVEAWYVAQTSICEAYRVLRPLRARYLIVNLISSANLNRKSQNMGSLQQMLADEPGFSVDYLLWTSYAPRMGLTEDDDERSSWLTHEPTDKQSLHIRTQLFWNLMYEGTMPWPVGVEEAFGWKPKSTGTTASSSDYRTVMRQILKV